MSKCDICKQYNVGNIKMINFQYVCKNCENYVKTIHLGFNSTQNVVLSRRT